MSEVAIIIPCFNERERLPRFLEELRRACPSARVVVVEDGSTERVDVAEAERLHVLAYAPNRGKGYAIRHGWDWVMSHYGETEVLAFCDADGAVSAGEMSRFWQLFQAGGMDALAGNRIRMLGRRVERHALRHYLGRVYATLVSLMLDLPAYDTQCGCKWMKASVYRQMGPKLKVDGFAFDVEWYARLYHAGFCLEEAALDWEEMGGSKVHPLRDGWRMIRAAYGVRSALLQEGSFRSR
jgi:dolichyl-phosphate beta-glucosyltransferase